MTKLKAGIVAKSIVKRLLDPRHVARAVRLERGRKNGKKDSRASDDPQLALLSKILPGGFLHYGYFDDPDRPPEEISLAEFSRSQRRYAEVLLDLVQDVSDPASPVLDVGCGMGTLSVMLRERGFSPVALTPDRTQVEHIRQTLPDIPVIHSKFEDLPDPEQHAGRYGTVITSESLQYLKLPRALPVMERILKPGGTWIACDFFRTGESRGKGGHNWGDFTKALAEHGWEISYERDVTAHIMPTLRAAHMWGNDIGLPVLDFAVNKLRRKRPALHYILEETLAMLDQVIATNLKEIDPADFARHRRYVLLTMRRAVEGPSQ